MGEVTATAFLEQEIAEKCPFKDVNEGVDEEDTESIEDDDRDGVKREQANNGGTLGNNLKAGSPGSSATVGGPYPPPKSEPDSRVDTRRQKAKGKKLLIGVPGTFTIPDGEFPFTLAAHHLVPGNASLKPSALKKFMTKGEAVDVEVGGKKKKYTIEKHIGYNVNGAHNGVWLVGNYAIRTRSSPTRETWSILITIHDDWCHNYAAAANRVTGKQFHDTHSNYNERILDILNKITVLLAGHLESGLCEHCKSNTKISPPFLIKERLYNLSNYLKSELVKNIGGWRYPWITSDRWAHTILTRRGSVFDGFHEAWLKAKKIES